MNEVALFENALRAAVPRQPDPRVGSELVRRLASTARAVTLEAETRTTTRAAAGTGAGRRRSRFALVARIAVAVALIPLALAGLAFAGVNLPEPARDAFDKVGVTLPNQPSDEPQPNAAPKSTQGGNDVSDAAKSGPSTEQGNSTAAHQHAREQRKKARGKAVGHTRGKAIGLNEATPPGQSGDTGPPAHSNSSQSSPRSAPSDVSSRGVGPGQPFPSQAHGKALGRSK
jgi:hypothetical protein